MPGGVEGGKGAHLHKQIISTIRYDHIYPYVHNPGITCKTRPKWRHNIKRKRVGIVIIGIGGKNGNVIVIFYLFTFSFPFSLQKLNLIKTYLVPSDEQLRVGVLEEAAHISSTEGDTGQTEGQHHRNGGLQVAPLPRVVTRPHSAYTSRVSQMSSKGISVTIKLCTFVYTSKWKDTTF